MNEIITHKILIVDDDELITNLLEDYLSGLGYDVISADNAEKAIHFLNNGDQFSLVITDVNLPGKSGLELLKIINETKDELPVILLTGLKTIDTAISALQSGAADYITKPFDLNTVQKIIQKVLKKQSRSRKKEKIYENLEHLKLSFKFKTKELDPDILAKEISSILQKMRFSDDDVLKQYELVFTETLINGIEHGNLELPSAIKNNDILQMAKFEELREKRLQDPEYADREIEIIFECGTESFNFTVKDSGPGFDWRKYIDNNHKISDVNLNPYGRGFLIIGHIIDEVYFNDKGNMITLVKYRPELNNKNIS